MSGVIKAGAGAGLARRIDPRRTPAIVVPIVSATERALAEARDEIAALHIDLAETRRDAEQAVHAAQSAGEQAGRAAAIEQSDRRLEVIALTAEAARARFDDRLSEIDALAAMIARAALGRIVRDVEDFVPLVTQQIALRIAALRDGSVVAIRVSSDDFADDAALAALASDARTGAVGIVADPALAPGDCRFDLQLGHIDLGVRAQWGALDALLEMLVAGEGAR